VAICRRCAGGSGATIHRPSPFVKGSEFDIPSPTPARQGGAPFGAIPGRCPMQKILLCEKGESHERACAPFALFAPFRGFRGPNTRRRPQQPQQPSRQPPRPQPRRQLQNHFELSLPPPHVIPLTTPNHVNHVNHVKHVNHVNHANPRPDPPLGANIRRSARTTSEGYSDHVRGVLGSRPRVLGSRAVYPRPGYSGHPAHRKRAANHSPRRAFGGDRLLTQDFRSGLWRIRSGYVFGHGFTRICTDQQQTIPSRIRVIRVNPCPIINSPDSRSQVLTLQQLEDNHGGDR
jgi:hypothetical protein